MQKHLERFTEMSAPYGGVEEWDWEGVSRSPAEKGSGSRGASGCKRFALICLKEKAILLLNMIKIDNYNGRDIC